MHEQGLQLLPQFRVEAITRQGDDDAHASAVDIATDQHPDAAVLLQLEQADDQLPKLLGRSLEEFVFREGLEQLHGLLVVV